MNDFKGMVSKELLILCYIHKGYKIVDIRKQSDSVDDYVFKIIRKYRNSGLVKRKSKGVYVFTKQGEKFFKALISGFCALFDIKNLEEKLK